MTLCYMTNLGTQMLEVKKSLRIHKMNLAHPRHQVLTQMIKMVKKREEVAEALQTVNQKLVR